MEKKTFNYKNNSELWTIEDLAAKHGFEKTADCYWSQIFTNKETGVEFYTVRDESASADPVKAVSEYLEPAADTRKASISRGNRKMGAIPSVSLPPVKTCAANCPCAKKCYAVKMCRIYKNVKASYENNLEILESNPAAYWSQVNEAVKMTRYFRFHVSGDIPNMEYFQNMVSVAAHNPHCEILAFTKCYDIVNSYLDSHNGYLPKNLHVIFSLWDPSWNVRVKNPHDLPMSAVIFKGYYPGYADNFDKICPGNCFECACKGMGCWTLQNGETIAFYEH